MIEKIKLIPVTEKSVPFAQASEKCNFAEIGYVEEEYFMWGTANIYENGEDHAPITIYKDAPYVNRFIVRRPKDVGKFSGNVVIEILNATALFDIDRIWVNSWKYFTRNGDIYIGITSKSDVLDSLYAADRERYSILSWENPLPNRPEPKNTVFKFFPQYEAGLFWDMLTDFAKALRTKSEINPISQYDNYKLYLTGWSQSATYIVRYVKSFAYLEKNCSEGPIFDGYLAAGGGARPAPLNSYEPIILSGKSYFDSEGAGIMGAREPYIAVNTESENEAVRWKGDSDIPGNLFRAYEIPGASHDSVNNILKWYNADENYMVGNRKVYKGIDGLPNDYPYEYVFNAAFRNLYCWVREGVPAPHAEPIKRGPDGKNIRDVFGNAVGGIRTPFIDLPTATYYGFSTKPDGSQSVFGHMNPFSKEKMQAIYTSLKNYRNLAEKSTDCAVALGFILPEERDEVVELAVERAEAAGLR
jgi:hypothetical protein